MPKPIVYLISGLAADERVFRKLTLAAETRFLPWLKPLSAAEPLPQYAGRMAATIEPGRAGLIVGVSFGGMVALEIATHRPWLKPVQISSLNEPGQMPWHLKLIGLSRLYKLAPPQLLKLFPRVGAWFFGTKGKAEYTLFSQILENSDPDYMRWAIPQFLHWQPPACTQCLQLIGTEDRFFSADNVPGAIKIEGGTHLMAFTEAEKISEILNAEIAKLEAGNESFA